MDRLVRISGNRKTHDLPGSIVATRVSTGDWPPADHELRVVKRNRKVVSGFLQTAQQNLPGLFFKHYLTRPSLFSRRAAERIWRINWSLHNHGVPVPRPHALITGNSGVWLITEAIEGAAALTDRLADDALTPGQMQTVTIEATRAIAHMHSLGVIHGDLKWGNILVTEELTPALVDLDSARQRWRVSARAGAKDLARFIVGGLEQGLNTAWAARICSVYCETRVLSETTIYETMRPVVRRISLRHQRRYGRRPVSLDTDPEYPPNDNVPNSK